MTKKVVSIFLSVLIIFSTIVWSGSISGAALEESIYSAKLSPELKTYISQDNLAVYV